MKKLLLLIPLGFVAAAIYSTQAKNNGAVYTYGAGGNVQVVVTGVNTNQGFSFAILVGGKQVFADTIYATDGGYTVQDSTATYTINTTPINDGQVAIFIYQGQTQLYTVTLNWNGTEVK